MQGFNMGRYVPPDQEGVLTANQASGKGHALGARASRLAREGVLVVRFEMPFAVWCGTCAPARLIGQGVRFNAEKRRVGSYYSTPVWAFRLRHADCGGWLEVRTDPRNTAYVVTEGGRRRDTGDGEGKNGNDGDGDGDGRGDDSLVASGDALLREQLANLANPAEQQQQRETAFANLEKTIADRAALAAASARIDELGDVADRQWDDPYARNRALRGAFRAGRHRREAQARADDDLRARMGGGLAAVEVLLPESEEDARRARLVDFYGRRPADGEGEERALAGPLFGGREKGAGEKEEVVVTAKKKKNGKGKTVGGSRRLLKSEIAASKRKESLVSEIVGNTRSAKDPFLEPRSRDSTKPVGALLPGLKRKRVPSKEPSPPPPGEERPAGQISARSSALVDYDSE